MESLRKSADQSKGGGPTAEPPPFYCGGVPGGQERAYPDAPNRGYGAAKPALLSCPARLIFFTILFPHVIKYFKNFMF